MGLNIAKAPWCTLMHQGLSNSTKKTMGGAMVREILTWQMNKTNKTTFLHRYMFVSFPLKNNKYT